MACTSKSAFLKILPEPTPRYKEYSEQIYQTISTVPIPLALDEHLSRVYDDQLKYGIQLPVEIKLEKYTCNNGYPFHDPKPARSSKGIKIYTESDVIPLPGHQGKYYIRALRSRSLFDGSVLRTSS